MSARLKELDDLTKYRALYNLAITAVRNSNTAMRNVWLVLFSGATFATVHCVDNAFKCKVASSNHSIDAEQMAQCVGPLRSGWIDHPMTWFTLGVIYISYVLIFYRSYVSNIRVYDMRSTELIGFFEPIIKSKSYDPDEEIYWYKRLMRAINFNIDQNEMPSNNYFSGIRDHTMSILLMIRTLTIVGMSLYLNNPRIFIHIYVFVIIGDLIFDAIELKYPRYDVLKTTITDVIGHNNKLISKVDEMFNTNAVIRSLFTNIGMTIIILLSIFYTWMHPAPYQDIAQSSEYYFQITIFGLVFL